MHSVVRMCDYLADLLGDEVRSLVKGVLQYPDAVTST